MATGAMRERLLCVLLLISAACGGDDDGGGTPPADAGESDAAAAADAAAGLTGGYVRVVPGYDTEAACRAENPDKLFACLELVSLCADDVAYILFTDIVFGGEWVEDQGSATLTFETWDGAFSDAGTTVFTQQEGGAISSDEVYGERAFEPSDRDEDSLCP